MVTKQTWRKKNTRNNREKEREKKKEKSHSVINIAFETCWNPEVERIRNDATYLGALCAASLRAPPSENDRQRTADSGGIKSPVVLTTLNQRSHPSSILSNSSCSLCWFL